MQASRWHRSWYSSLFLWQGTQSSAWKLVFCVSFHFLVIYSFSKVITPACTRPWEQEGKKSGLTLIVYSLFERQSRTHTAQLEDDLGKVEAASLALCSHRLSRCRLGVGDIKKQSLSRQLFLARALGPQAASPPLLCIPGGKSGSVSTPPGLSGTYSLCQPPSIRGLPVNASSICCPHG